jgi:hypothetical protein
MKSTIGLSTALLLALLISGCASEKRDIQALEPGKPAPELYTVPEAGVYFLYSSKDDKKEHQRIEMKKGEQLGFRTQGNRAVGVAKGILIELPDYKEGASYYWKVEEKK